MSILLGSLHGRIKRKRVTRICEEKLYKILKKSLAFYLFMCYNIEKLRNNKHITKENDNMKLKELYEKFEKAEAITESIDYDDEAAWDEAYKSEYEAFCELADEIMNLIKCDRKTANTMLTDKREDIKALVARM